MPETVLYIRMPSGVSPFSRIDDKAVDDLRLLVAVPDDQWNQVVARFNVDNAFADKDFIGANLESVSDDDQRKSLTRLIYWTMLEGTDESIRKALRVIKNIETDESDEGKSGSPVFSDAQHAIAVARVEELLALCTLQRQAKAERLATVTGQRLKSLDLICDLRPVFNEPRSHVEGLIPFTTIKLTCEGVDGLPVAIEAVMSRSELNSLAQSVEFAQAKLKSLQQFAEECRRTIPVTDLTKE